jgi:hypothetical protein
MIEAFCSPIGVLSTTPAIIGASELLDKAAI